MSDSAPRLPARPSLEQLRKQAKDLVRDGEHPSLAEAQLALARKYGFASWPAMVNHIEQVQSANRLEQFERLADDVLAAYAGNPDALERVGAFFGDSYSAEQLRRKLEERLTRLAGHTGAPTRDSVRLLLARTYGSESWAAFSESLAQPDTPGAPARGFRTQPPYYQIDFASGTITLRPPIQDRDWDTIARVMVESGLTALQANGQMTDTGLARLAQWPGIRSLGLDGSRRLTDEGLAHLRGMPQLRVLDLSGWHNRFTDRGLEALRGLPELREFSLCWPQRVTDAGVAHLARCEQLESVNLMGTNTGDGAIEALTGKAGLRKVHTGRQVTDAGLARFAGFPAFARWMGGEPRYGMMDFAGGPTHLLVDGPFTNAGVGALARLEGLFSLNFFWHTSAMTSAALGALADMPNLGFLGCDGKICDDIAMRYIAAIPKLRMLMAQGTVASDAGFAALARSGSIEYIWGRECPNLGSDGFRALAGMPALRGLAVSCLGVDDAALATLPSFPKLDALMPMDVPDEGFRHIGKCRGLRYLWCMYCRDTGDAATGHLAPLALESYYAGQTRITDRSCDVLAAMPSLEKIELWNISGVSDAGLRALATLPRLREVALEGVTGISKAGVEAFPAQVRVRMS